MTLGKNEILDGMATLIQDGEMTALEGHVILTRELIEKLMNEKSNTSGHSTRAIGEPEKLIIIGKLLELKKEGKLHPHITIRGRNAPHPRMWIKSELGSIFPEEILIVLENPEYWYQVDKRLYEILKKHKNKGL